MSEERRIDKRGEQKRAWDEAHRLMCEVCGTPTGMHAASPEGRHPRCAQHSFQRERAAAKRARIVELWGQGLPVAEIAEAVGTTKGTINVEIVRMRGLGYDLPYRRPLEHIEAAKRGRGLDTSVERTLGS